jgi:hypothetical protein
LPMVCTMKSAAGLGGVEFFEWLKPSGSSPLPSPSASSRSTLSIDRSGGLDASLCLPLLDRLEERAASPDRGGCNTSPTKEELNIAAAGTSEEDADVELNIGLPAIGGYSSSEEGPMDEEDEEEDSENSEEHDDKCKVDAGDEQVRMEIVDGSDYLRVDGEENTIKGIRIITSRGRRYWIPTPAQILIGPVQFICHVCSKTFNRYNNMQVTDPSLPHHASLRLQ